MSDTDQSGPTELEMLKERAKLMGISFSNNISVETLRQRIEDKMAGLETAPESGSTVNGLEAAAAIADAKHSIPPAPVPAERELSPREKMMQEQLRLVRLRITNLDPKKANLPGEIFTVANEIIGTVRKFIPYGEVTDDGYHVPYILYQQLEQRRFLHIQTFKDKKTGTPRVKSSMAKEFAIEVLDPLTEEELRRLAIAQTAAGSVDGVDEY